MSKQNNNTLKICTMKFFATFNNIQELKKQYKKLALELHPDKGGNEEDFKAMSNEYQELLKAALKGKFPNDAEKVESELQIDEQLREALNKIINLVGLDIEICGNWIWVGGNTYANKKEIKEAGFKYAKKKSMWYWNDGTWTRKSRKTLSIDQIREQHGSTKVETRNLKQIA